MITKSEVLIFDIRIEQKNQFKIYPDSGMRWVVCQPMNPFKITGVMFKRTPVIVRATNGVDKFLRPSENCHRSLGANMTDGQWNWQRDPTQHQIAGVPTDERRPTICLSGLINDRWDTVMVTCHHGILIMSVHVVDLIKTSI